MTTSVESHTTAPATERGSIFVRAVQHDDAGFLYFSKKKPYLSVRKLLERTRCGVSGSE